MLSLIVDLCRNKLLHSTCATKARCRYECCFGSISDRCDCRPAGDDGSHSSKLGCRPRHTAFGGNPATLLESRHYSLSPERGSYRRTHQRQTAENSKPENAAA